MAGAGGGGRDDAGDGFYSDFMVLRPDKAGLYALFHLMWSCKMSENAAVDCPAGTEMSDWRRRWVVLVSLVAQMLMLWGKKPMALIGRVTEYWMNLVNENGGSVLVLILRALQGTLLSLVRHTVAEFPEPTIAATSWIIHYDQFMDLPVSLTCRCTIIMIAFMSLEVSFTYTGILLFVSDHTQEHSSS